MTRFLKYAALGCAGLAALGLGAVFVMLQSLPKDRLVAEARAKLETVTGARILIEAEPSLVLLPRPGYRTGPVRTTGDSGTQPAFAADSITLQPTLAGLLDPAHENILISIHGARIKTGPDGRLLANWQAMTDWTGSIDLTDATVELQQPDGAEARIVTGAQISARMSPRAPARADGQPSKTLMFDLTSGADRIAMSGTIGASAASGFSFKGDFEIAVSDAALLEVIRDLLPALPLDRASSLSARGKASIAPDDLFLQTRAQAMAQGRTITADLVLNGASGWQDAAPVQIQAVSRSGALYSAHFDGTGTLAGDSFEGDFNFTGIDLPALLTWLDMTDLGQLTAAKRARLSGTLKRTADVFFLADSVLNIGTQQFEGSATLDLSSTRPRLDLRTTRDSVVLGAGLDAPLGLLRDLAAFSDPGADATLSLETKQLTLAGHTGRDAVLTLGKSGLETFAKLTGSAFGGDIDVSGRITASAAERIELRLAGVGLDAGSLGTWAGLTGLQGGLTGDLLLSVGLENGQVAPARTRGFGEISIFGGQFAPPDLWAVSGNQSPATEPSRFSSFAAAIAVTDNAIEMRDIRLSRPEGSLSGSAGIELGTDLISGRLVPGADFAAPAYPVVLSGTLDQMIAEPVVPDPVPQTGAQPDLAGIPATATATGSLPETAPQQDSALAIAEADTAGTPDTADRPITDPVPIPIPAPR